MDSHLIKALYRIVELQEEILAQLKNDYAMLLPGKNASGLLQDLVDNADVKSFLKISDSTLYRIKKRKLINAVRIGKRDYYNMAEIKNIVSYFKR